MKRLTALLTSIFIGSIMLSACGNSSPKIDLRSKTETSTPLGVYDVKVEERASGKYLVGKIKKNSEIPEKAFVEFQVEFFDNKGKANGKGRFTTKPKDYNADQHTIWYNEKDFKDDWDYKTLSKGDIIDFEIKIENPTITQVELTSLEEKDLEVWRKEQLEAIGKIVRGWSIDNSKVAEELCKRVLLFYPNDDEVLMWQQTAKENKEAIEQGKVAEKASSPPAESTQQSTGTSSSSGSSIKGYSKDTKPVGFFDVEISQNDAKHNSPSIRGNLVRNTNSPESAKVMGLFKAFDKDNQYMGDIEFETSFFLSQGEVYDFFCPVSSLFENPVTRIEVKTIKEMDKKFMDKVNEVDAAIRRGNLDEAKEIVAKLKQDFPKYKDEISEIEKLLK